MRGRAAIPRRSTSTMTARTSRSIPASSSTTSSTIPISRRCLPISASPRMRATWAFRCRSTAAGSNGAAPVCRSIFAQKRNFFSPSFLWMLREILRFNRQCVEDRDAGHLAHRSIGDYLEHRKFSAGFRDNYLIPMAAAIWSTPRIKMLDYPAATFVSFFENHRLIHRERPAWRTVTGGSRNYLEKLLEPLGRAHPAVGAGQDDHPRRVRRHRLGGRCGRPNASTMSSSPRTATRRWRCSAIPRRSRRTILSAIAYRPNRVVLHRDPAPDAEAPRRVVGLELPALERRRATTRDVCVTYWMNRLQGIDERMPLFVSLNPVDRAAPGPDVRRMELRASAVRRARAVGAGAPRRHPGRAPHLLRRRLDRAWLPRGRAALRPRRGDRARRDGALAQAARGRAARTRRWRRNERHDA